ncbi:hypothetical protein BLOT_007587, partial [Blomia tropicalis]
MTNKTVIKNIKLKFIFTQLFLFIFSISSSQHVVLILMFETGIYIGFKITNCLLIQLTLLVFACFDMFSTHQFIIRTFDTNLFCPFKLYSEFRYFHFL